MSRVLFWQGRVCDAAEHLLRLEADGAAGSPEWADGLNRLASEVASLKMARRQDSNMLEDLQNTRRREAEEAAGCEEVHSGG